MNRRLNGIVANMILSYKEKKTDEQLLEEAKELKKKVATGADQIYQVLQDSLKAVQELDNQRAKHLEYMRNIYENFKIDLKDQFNVPYKDAQKALLESANKSMIVGESLNLLLNEITVCTRVRKEGSKRPSYKLACYLKYTPKQMEVLQDTVQKATKVITSVKTDGMEFMDQMLKKFPEEAIAIMKKKGYSYDEETNSFFDKKTGERVVSGSVKSAGIMDFFGNIFKSFKEKIFNFFGIKTKEIETSSKELNSINDSILKIMDMAEKEQV